jgi:NAD(P)-dependent dehydrogenase (short-subunit alcohol dehydrogenase family)
VSATGKAGMMDGKVVVVTGAGGGVGREIAIMMAGAGARVIVADIGNAPLAVYLCSDAAAGVSGQVFGTRMHAIYLFSSPRPVRIVHRADGWTPERVAAMAAPALKAGFMPLDTSETLFSWDPA